jgi:cytochrome c oxidase assembly protein subunit 15
MLFRRLSLITVAVVYLLILAGGIVRATGSGMGCPDWPRCFGRWVPPTEASQLPPDYAQLYGAKLKGEVVFNAAKTWTEYVNRLLGVATGLFIFGSLLVSVPFLKKDPAIFWLSLLAFVLVGFEGWLGSKVVSTELHPVMVTLHMVVAIVIVFVLLYAVARSYSGCVVVETVTHKPALNRLLWVAIGLSLAQVVLGTQVREDVDGVIRQLGYENRDGWIAQLGAVFYVHRSFSLLVLAVHGYLIYRLRQSAGRGGVLWSFSRLLLGLVVVEIATGAAMAYFGVPAFLQPVHLTLAVVALGIQFVLFLLLNRERVFGRASAPMSSETYLV